MQSLTSAFSAFFGIADFFFLFLYFRRQIKADIRRRIGRTEYIKRMSRFSPLGRYLFSGCQKHSSGVCLLMNALLPVTGLSGILLGIVGTLVVNPLAAKCGLILSAGMAALSLWLILVRFFFEYLAKEALEQLQQASVVLFVLVPFMILCLKLAGA